MNPLLNIFVTLGSIAFAAAYPFLVRRPRVREIADSLVPSWFRPGESGGFSAVDPDEQRRLPPEDLLRRMVIEAIGFVSIVSGSLFLLGSTRGSTELLPAPVAAAIGIGAGILLRRLWLVQEQLTEIRRCGRRLRESGIEGSWQGNADDPIPFRRELLRSVQESTGLDVLSPSGLSTLAALSHPARAAFEAPHPALAGKRIRLIVLPPRSQRVDPQRTRRSCAEEALSRAGTTPEKHWRRLQRALEVQRRWNTEFGCNLQVKFIEGRPMHALMMAGTRGWFRPWYGAGQDWFEVAARGTGTDFRTSLDDHFECSWQDASEELSVFVRKDGSAAVMAANSTAVG